MKRFFVIPLLAFWITLAVTPVLAQQADWEQRAPQELAGLFAALASGDTSLIERHLAAEFQIIRSNGASYDKDGYLQRSVPVIRSTPRFRNVKVTGQADIRVITFNLEVNETIDGHAVENLAPNSLCSAIWVTDG